MRKGILVLLLVLFLVPSSFATLTKLSTMGYSFLFMKDDYNIWSFPQTAVLYQNHIIAEHPHAGTVIVKLGENDALGVRVTDQYAYDFLGFDDMLYYIVADMYYAYESNYYMFPQDKFSLVYAHKFEKMRLGIMFNTMGASYKETNSEDYDPTYNLELKTGIMSLTGGFSMDIGEGHELDLAVSYSHATFKWSDNSYDPATITTPDGGNSFGGTGRLMYKWNDQVTLIPAISFGTGSIGNKWSDSYPYGEKDSRTMFNFGLGCNYKPNEKFELISALGLYYDREKYNYTYYYGTIDDNETYSEFEMPYFLMGMDLNVKSWLNFRLGINKELESLKGTYDSGELTGDDIWKWTSAPFEYTLGAGIMLGDLQFDCMVNTDFLNNGPYWISGAETYTMFPQISIKYNFK
jgi:hypothetical protein